MELMEVFLLEGGQGSDHGVVKVLLSVVASLLLAVELVAWALAVVSLLLGVELVSCVLVVEVA